MENLQFASNFKFGTSSISYQTEGREIHDRKGLSMWDEFSQSHPKNILDRSTGEDTCSSTKYFQEDVLLLKSMNATSYNFTLSWSRILPAGTTRFVNQQGLDYYDNLINTLLENGIEPIVTLSDLDLPYNLLRTYAGGWMNRKLILAFESYAKLCFAKFGDRVQRWITFPPPWPHAWNCYGAGIHPPNLCLGFKGAYLALSNLLKAHALVYRLYQKRFGQFGKVGIAVSCDSKEKSSISHQLERVMHPLIHGKYLINQDSPKSAQEIDNQCLSTLVSDDWQTVLKNCYDFIALHVTPEINAEVKSCKITMKSQKVPCPSESIKNVLHTLRNKFGNPEVLVFCVGPPLALPSQMMDIDRAQYFNLVAKGILEASNIDKCHVTGYFPGKLMDCWESEFGFTISHGLFHVEFSSSQKKRSPRASVVFVLKHLFKERQVQPDLF